MKKILKITLLLILLYSKSMQSQSTQIENLNYLGQSISNCGNIYFNLSTNHNIQFDVVLSRPYYDNDPNLGSTGILRVLYWTGSGEIEEKLYNIGVSSWTVSGINATVTKPVNITLNSSDFDNSTGGMLYARFHDTAQNFFYESCAYDIIKPEFNFVYDNLVIPCGSSASKTFTVINVNNIPRTLSYIWNVGTGWKRNGVAVNGTFTTTNNSITLEPASGTILPSNVSVTVTVDGASYPTKTAPVSRASFSTSATISGSGVLCSSGIYTVSNLPSGVSIQSVSSSNSNIATTTLESNGDITVTKVSNGVITLSVVLQNACSQTVTKTKNIQAGENANVDITGLENGIDAGGSASLSLINSNGCGEIYFTDASSGLTFDYVGPDYAVLSSTSSNSGTGWVYISITGGTSIYKEFPINTSTPPNLPNENYISIARIENNYNVYPYSQWKMVKAYYYGNSNDVDYWEWNIGNSYYAKPNDTSIIFLPSESSNVNVSVRACNNDGCSQYVSTVIN